MCISFSKILAGNGKIDIGLRSDTLLTKPSFFKGVTVASFHKSGNIALVIQ